MLFEVYDFVNFITKLNLKHILFKTIYKFIYQFKKQYSFPEIKNDKENKISHILEEVLV